LEFFFSSSVSDRRGERERESRKGQRQQDFLQNQLDLPILLLFLASALDSSAAIASCELSVFGVLSEKEREEEVRGGRVAVVR